MSFIVHIVILITLFAVLYIKRENISAFLGRLPVPTLVTFLIVSSLLVVIEEQVNCEAKWCGTVLIPPTYPYLMAELIVVYVLWKILKGKSIWKFTLIYAAIGLAWEFFIGGLHGVGLPLPIFLFFVLWVVFSYVIISYTPLHFLSKKAEH